MGKFIAIEGGDGSGKGTQTKLLVDNLKSEGYDVLETDFPRYGEDSAYYVERYLNGDYGGSEDVPAELGSLPYAIDRYAAKNDIITHLIKPKSIVISNRYVASNLAHQGAKISDSIKRKAFYERTMLTEYKVLDIPKPDLNIVLIMPTANMQSNVDKKATRSYTTNKRDIHEADINHLDKAKSNYIELCNIYPDEFTRIDCINGDGEMHSILATQKMILELVSVD